MMTYDAMCTLAADRRRQLHRSARAARLASKVKRA